MVMVPLKGVAKTSSRGHVYYYAWRGGPRLEGAPGSPEFHASYTNAHEDRKKPDLDRFRSLVTLYRGGPFLNLAASTKRNWTKWLDAIASHFGDLRVAQFDRLEKVRPLIRAWRNQFASKPRTADYGMQVLSRVLKHGVELGKLAGNACDGIGHLYGGNRAEVIWTDDDLARVKSGCLAEMSMAIDLAAMTGLRRGDLVAVSWSHVGEDAIVMRTSKSNGRREAYVPLYDALKALLARIPKRATTILTSSFGTPWTENGLGSSFNKAKHDAGMQQQNLHFNDLRGTAATRFYLAGLSVRVIAEIMGWEEDSVDRIIRRYVDRSAATRAIIRQINEAKK